MKMDRGRLKCKSIDGQLGGEGEEANGVEVRRERWG